MRIERVFDWRVQNGDADLSAWVNEVFAFEADKNNITSSLSMLRDHLNFATLTRQLASKSSQWIYRLDYYDTSPKKLETIDVYATYNINKHFLTFVPTSSSRSLIAVTTVNNLIFYRTTPLEKMKETLHRQANNYDLNSKSQL